MGEEFLGLVFFMFIMDMKIPIEGGGPGGGLRWRRRWMEGEVYRGL